MRRYVWTPIGNETKVKVVKNKVSPPFKQAEFDILFGEGISREGEILDMGVIAKIVEKSGAWYAYNGEKIGQGRDNSREFLRENPSLAIEIENKVRESLGIALLPVSSSLPGTETGSLDAVSATEATGKPSRGKKAEKTAINTAPGNTANTDEDGEHNAQ